MYRLGGCLLGVGLERSCSGLGCWYLLGLALLLWKRCLWVGLAVSVV